MMGNTRFSVHRLFMIMERRLQQNPEWTTKYIAFMRDYINDGHMQRAVNIPQQYPIEVFFPHHVFAADKKFRVVFNGSHPSSSGLSFNEVQYAGPRLQEVLHVRVITFRMFKIALNADIKKMFRQVAVNPKQYNLQKISWRESPDDPIEEYQITRVPYGFTCASYVSVRALQQCARIIWTRFHWVSILNRFYMDDYLDSMNAMEQAIETR